MAEGKLTNREGLIHVFAALEDLRREAERRALTMGDDTAWIAEALKDIGRIFAEAPDA